MQFIEQLTHHLIAIHASSDVKNKHTKKQKQTHVVIAPADVYICPVTIARTLDLHKLGYLKRTDLACKSSALGLGLQTLQWIDTSEC